MSELEKERSEGVDWRKDRKKRGNEVVIVGGDGGSIEEGRRELSKGLGDKGNYDYY
ncbi:poly-gamma-glutamate hydrolase family protein [Staphylococcus epidermidis]|uniref:poly-gamma-glutamate hydrolase family protein n=1 Tax=Staphylococcus epidermidis TaxID=1282 RepID=UPI0021B3AFAC|nr:poly-gamma-glutamate hydrolase family protein [Staphylococcus epidermidis]